jgi:S-formylglutathione hydrolase
MPDGWSRVEIGGKPADAFEPVGGRFALLFLHPHGGPTPAGNAILAAELRRHRLRCVAPHDGQSWWVDRVCPEFDLTMTPERHLLDHVVPWIEARWNPGPRGIAAAGIGMGGQAAVRLGLRHPDRFPVVASAAGAFDFHEWHGRGTPLDEMYPTRERARQDTAVLQLDPHRWPPHVWFACDPDDEWYRGNDRLDEKLTAYGVPHVANLDTRASPDALAAPMLAFVADALERESRRLV